MPKSHKAYPLELKKRLVELARAGRNPEELAEKFEPTAQSIRNWVAQADRDDGRRQDGLTTEEREELRRLRREVKALREEREILKGSSGYRVGRTVSRLRNEGCRGSTRRRPYRAIILPVRAVSVTEQRRTVNHASRPQAPYPH